MAFATYDVHVTAMRKDSSPLTVLACKSYLIASQCQTGLLEKGQYGAIRMGCDMRTYYLTYNADVVVHTLAYCLSSGLLTSPVRTL